MSDQEVQKLIDEAVKRGRFEGEVLTSLSDIKQTLEDFKLTTNTQAKDISELATEKADRKDVDDLKKKVWALSGAAAVIGTVLGKLL